MTQEPWDFARFVQLYNRLAKERGGWQFEHDLSEEELRGRYLRWPQHYPDLQHFAEGQFGWEQRLNL